MAREQIKPIELPAESNIQLFLIHGYTGSPTDFYKLPYFLHKSLNVNVKVILLKGHGTTIEDLDNVYYEDFLAQLTDEIETDISKGKQIILCGMSMGGLFSLILASKYNVMGVVNVSVPYTFKFPFNVPKIENLGKIKKYWKKPRTKNELNLRKGSFSYTHMHKNGLMIAKHAKIELDKTITNIKCPVLTLHSKTDKLGHYKSAYKIRNKVDSKINEAEIFTIIEHNVFYSEHNNIINEKILSFIQEKIISCPNPVNNKVAAIIPAFNEAERIENVLNAITKAEIIDEIIVIDDGSIDNTEEIVRKFVNVKYLKNEKNIGKAGSMERGVNSTDADIIFFCDADLINLTPDIITAIVTPVLNNETAMFIGLRENFMQNSVHLFAINSGERSMRRSVWEKLPKYFKYKYRVEAGLNYYVKKYLGGFKYKTLPYSQPIKEKKYGFLKGTYLRWSMNLDVMYVYVRESLENLFGNK